MGQLRHAAHVGLDRFSAQEVFQLHRPERRYARTPAQDLRQLGHRARFDAGIERRAHHPSHHQTGRRRHGDDDPLDPVAVDDCSHVRQFAENGDVSYAHPLFSGIVVHEPHRNQLKL